MLRKNLFAVVTLLSGIMVMSSCNDKRSPGWEYMPDMYRGPAVETYQEADNLKDSMSALQPVEGTIPRGFTMYRELPNTNEGYEMSKTVLKMPENIGRDSLTIEKTKELYTIFCAHCHGETGNGQGVLVKREKILGVPSYADREINHGSIFYVITYGKGIMGSHAAQVTPEERWMLAEYVMKLRRELTGEGGVSETSPEAPAAQDTVSINTTETN